MKVHKAACLWCLFGFFTPLLLLGCDVLIRQQRLCIPDRGIADYSLEGFDICWGFSRTGGLNFDSRSFSTCINATRKSKYIMHLDTDEV